MIEQCYNAGGGGGGEGMERGVFIQDAITLTKGKLKLRENRITVMNAIDSFDDSIEGIMGINCRFSEGIFRVMAGVGGGWIGGRIYELMGGGGRRRW